MEDKKGDYRSGGEALGCSAIENPLGFLMETWGDLKIVSWKNSEVGVLEGEEPGFPSAVRQDCCSYCDYCSLTQASQPPKK